MKLYITSQILIVLAYIILGIGLRKEKRIQILNYSNIYQLLLMFSYMLLGGIMGILSSIISLCRNILFIYNEKRNRENSKMILIVLSIISISLTIIFYKSPIDFFPCILTLIGIYSYWCKDTKVTRIGNILVSACYIIYAIPLKSWFSIIAEMYIVINTLIGCFKYEKKKVI